jgi:hypothetical protein
VIEAVRERTLRYFSKKYWLVSCRYVLLPLLFYFVFFCILSFPLILKFSTHLFADQGDGLQSVWDIWWINKAVTQLQCSPWYTNYVHYPHGVSLLPQTMTPFNGFMAVFLLRFMSLNETYNFILIFSFVIGGWSAFLLSQYLTKTYWGSIIAGFIFTFSNYHFAHAEGHLQMISLEWMPLFLLCFYILISKPSILASIGSAITLFAVILCDYYYFFYCVLSALIMTGWRAIRGKNLFFIFQKKYLYPLATFISFSLITSGTLVYKLFMLNRRDPLLGSHPPLEFSTDLLAPFIPGGHWRFADLTKFYWSRISGNIHENSVYIGLSVCCMLIYVWIKRHKLKFESLYLFYFFLIFFFVLSLGPALQIGGKIYTGIKMPYLLLEHLLPFIKLSGCPVRMMVMVMLSASVICAVGFEMLFQNQRTRWILTGIMLILFFEYLPQPIPSSNISIPKYVDILKKLPGNEGVIDLAANSPPLSLYYQTVYNKPMAFGYISRTPSSVAKEDKKLMKILREKDFSKLYHNYHFGYLVVRKTNDQEDRIFKLSDLREDQLVSLPGGIFGDEHKPQILESLPNETNNVLYNIDECVSDGEHPFLRGWAFIDGQDSKNCSIYLVLLSDKMKYIISTSTQERHDVTEYYKHSSNQDHSGFILRFSKKYLRKGEYKVAIYIRNNKIKAFRYTNLFIHN